MALVKERAETDAVWKHVRGVRYLVQDKEAGVMLRDKFIEGLKWLGRERLTFDLGVDARQGGLGQLREAVQMMGAIYRTGKDGLVIVISMFSIAYLRYGSCLRC